jgi:hypothetical protein
VNTQAAKIVGRLPVVPNLAQEYQSPLCPFQASGFTTRPINRMEPVVESRIRKRNG